MNLSKMIVVIFLCTAMALSYVHLSTAHIILSYEIRTGEESYHRLLDYNSHLRYNLTRLASCANLEKTLTAQNRKVDWPAERSVLTLAPTGSRGPVRFAANVLTGAIKALANVFSIKREAYAKPLEAKSMTPIPR